MQASSIRRKLYADGIFEYGTPIPDVDVVAHPGAATLTFYVGTHKFQQPLIGDVLQRARDKFARGKAHDGSLEGQVALQLQLRGRFDITTARSSPTTQAQVANTTSSRGRKRSAKA